MLSGSRQSSPSLVNLLQEEICSIDTNIEDLYANIEQHFTKRDELVRLLGEVPDSLPRNFRVVRGGKQFRAFRGDSLLVLSSARV